MSLLDKSTTVLHFVFLPNVAVKSFAFTPENFVRNLIVTNVLERVHLWLRVSQFHSVYAMARWYPLRREEVDLH